MNPLALARTVAITTLLVGCGGESYNPSGPTFTLLYTGNVGGNLEPCG